MMDHVVLLDRIRTIGRMNADERVAHFLLEIVSRLRITSSDITDTFDLPLSQELIGDALGLTNVYVSRSFTALEKDGLIRRSNGSVEILEEDRMKRICDFSDRHTKLDTSWFPDGTPIEA